MKSLRLRREERLPLSSRIQRVASFVQEFFSRGLGVPRSRREASRRFSVRCRAEQLEPRLVLDGTVVFNEIMYNPSGPDETLEWIELYNQQSVNMDLSAWSLSGGVDYTFPEETVIPGGGYLVIAANPAALEAAGDYDAALGPYEGRLSNAGETLRLLSNNGRAMNEVEYGDGGQWPVGPDGGGVSLAKRDHGSASGSAQNWTHSGIVGGTPGADNFPDPDDVPRVFTDLIPTTTAARVLVPASAEDVAADWTDRQFDDQAAANWFDATTGIGFDTSDMSPLSNLIDPAGDIEVQIAGQNASALIRVPFNVDNPAALDRLDFEIAYDDGFVAYLNGTEIARRNAPEGTPAWNATATETSAFAQTPPPETPANVNAISLNFASGRDTDTDNIPTFDMAFEMVAGVVRTNSWNNLRGMSGTNAGLTGNQNEPTAATVTWNSNGTWQNGLTTVDGDTTMMKSYLDARAPGSGFGPPNDATITVFGLPAGYTGSGYDVYVYFDASTDTGAVTAGYTIDNETFWINDTSTFDGSTYVLATSADRSNPTVGANYAKFSGLTTESFTLLADSDTFRAEVSGIQIVSLNEASTFSSTIDNLADLVAGTNILAIHGLNSDASDEDFLIRPKLTAREVPPSQATLPDLVINEVAAATETEFWLEIRNTGSTAINLDGLILSASTGEAYVFPAQSLAAGDRLALTESTLGFASADNDKLFLFTASGDQLLDARSVTNQLRGRSEAYDGRWLYPDLPTPGTANSFSFAEEIVINEILYNARPEVATPGVPAQFDVTQLVSLSSAQWRYNATGAGLDSTWPNTPHTAGTDGWSSTTGAGLFGYETTPDALPDVIRTPIADPEDVSRVSYYFETDFTFGGGDNSELLLRYVIDDGAVFYLNGQEVLRTNMPGGPITSNTSALSAASNATSVGPVVISAEALVVGTNRLSVEVHQAHGITNPSNDLVFGAELVSRVQTAPGEPFADSPEEWIELYNRGTAAVSLEGWSIRDAVSFDFPQDTLIAPGGYLLVARDAAALAADYPDIEIAGSFSGTLSNGGERILLRDADKNPADEVRYFDSTPWPDQADGLGGSLELRSPWADNSAAQSWAASDEGAKTDWTEYTFRRTASADVGPGIWNEFVFGMLDAGEVLIDDVSVIRDPDTAPLELIQNGTFEADTLGSDPDKWRIIGNHQGTVVSDPLNPDGNKVLHLLARDSAEHQSNNAGTTFVDNTPVSNGTTYEVSFRAKWLSGSNQLNSRFYLSRVAVTTILDVPELGGTPGMENSRFEANVGPTYRDLSQSTPLPDVSEDVTISLAAADPDGIASLTLRWSLDGEPFADLPMSVGADGRYQATIPGQTASTIVQFYVLGADTLGATSTFPAAGADSRALIKFDDGQSNPRQTHTLRIIMTTAETNNMFVAQNLMSNDQIGATVIYNNEIFYNVGVRLKGSSFGRTNGALQRSYSLRFPADQLFRGVQQTIHLDGSGRSHFVGVGQDEIISKQVINHAGGNLPSLYDDLVYMIAPRASQSGPVILQLARYTNGFLDESFENGSDGLLYKYELIYYASGTIDGDPEGPKNPSPPGYLGTNIRNLGDDKENYRWTFMAKNNRDRDDFDRVIEMAKAFDLTGDALQAATAELMDVDSWMRTFAIESLVGNTDVYTIGAPHNLYLYVRPTDQKVMAFPWDMDNNFNLSPSAGLHGGGNLSKIIELPANRRVFQGNLLDIINTTYNTDYMSQWTDSYGSLTGQNYSDILDYIGQRSASVLSQLPAEFPFEITTDDTAIADTTATVEGRGWINVRQVRMAGSNDPLDVVWLDDERWQVTLPVGFGSNSFTLEAYDYQGDFTGSDTINIESTVSLRPVQDFLRITELHYNPDGSDDTEFVELKNVSSGPNAVTLDLTNVTIADGPSSPYTFAAGRMLGPGEFVLVVKNQSAFVAAYPSVDAALIDGQFDGSLSNSGERIQLLDADGATVLDFTYEDGSDLGEEPWREETDGKGFSLVIKDENGASQDWSQGSRWRSSARSGGSPGADDPLPLAADFNGDGAVGRSDVVTLLKGFGASAGAHRGTGDTNQDRMATLADLATVQVQLGPAPDASPPAAPESLVVDASSPRRSARLTSASRRDVSSRGVIRSSTTDAPPDPFVAPAAAIHDLSRLLRRRTSRRFSPALVDAVISEVTDKQIVELTLERPGWVRQNVRQAVGGTQSQ